MYQKYRISLYFEREAHLNYVITTWVHQGARTRHRDIFSEMRNDLTLITTHLGIQPASHPESSDTHLNWYTSHQGYSIAIQQHGTN